MFGIVKIRNTLQGSTCTHSLLKTSLGCLTGHSGPVSRPSLMGGIRQGQKSHLKTSNKQLSFGRICFQEDLFKEGS